MGRHCRDAQAGADVEAGAVGKNWRAGAVDCDVLRSGAKTAGKLGLVNPHALADTAPIDAVTYGLYDSGAVAVWNDEAIVQQIWKRASPLFDIRWVDAAGMQAHEYLAEARRRRFDLTDLQDLTGRPELIKVSRAQRSPACCRFGREHKSGR